MSGAMIRKKSEILKIWKFSQVQLENATKIVGKAFADAFFFL